MNSIKTKTLQIGEDQTHNQIQISENSCNRCDRVMLRTTSTPWFESECLREEHPDVTYIGNFKVGSKVSIDSKEYEIKHITQRWFKNHVIHEVLECEDFVLLNAFDWEHVEPHKDIAAKMCHFIHKDVTWKYLIQSGKYKKSEQEYEYKDEILTWQPIVKDQVNVISMLFVKNGTLNDYVNVIDFKSHVEEMHVQTYDEYVADVKKQTA